MCDKIRKRRRRRRRVKFTRWVTQFASRLAFVVVAAASVKWITIQYNWSMGDDDDDDDNE